MPYCSKCGVEVEESAATCPLCRAPIQHLEGDAPREESSTYPQHIIDPDDAYRLSQAERRRMGVELLTLVAGLATAALVLVDIFPDGALGWSCYAIGSVAGVWLLSILPLLLTGKPRLMVVLMLAVIVAYLCFIDALDGSMDWSLSLGTPIALATFLAAYLTTVALRSRAIKGINLFGIGALGLAGYLMALECIIKFALHVGVRPYWSVVTALVLVPIAIFLFYLHGRVLRGADLRKIFRL